MLNFENFKQAKIEAAIERNLFRFKDKVKDKFKQTFAIYRINCAECSSFYIGKMERIMGYRYKKHIYKPKSGAKTPNKNAPYKHGVLKGHQIENHKYDFEGIEILNRADSNLKVCRKAAHS